MFYHIYHCTVPFRSFPSRLVLSPSSSLPPSLIDASPVSSDPVLFHLVLLFSVPSSCSIEIPSHNVPFLFFPCRVIPFCHVLTRIVPCDPVTSCSVSSLLVPPRPVLLHPVPSLPALSRPIFSRPKPSRLFSCRLVLFKSIYSHPGPPLPLIHISSCSVTSCFHPPSPIFLHLLTIESLHIRRLFVFSAP